MQAYESRFYTLIYIGLMAIAFGIFVSVSLPSLYHVLALIPLIYFTQKGWKEGMRFPLSTYFLIGLILTGYISNLMNIDTLNDPLRSFGKQKYYIFGILSIFSFRNFFKDYLGNYRIKRILDIFFFTIIAAAIYGTLKNRYDFDLLQMKSVWTKQSRNGGFTGIMRYGYGTGFVLSIMFGMFLYRNKMRKILGKMFYIALAFGIAGLVLSFTRGAMLGLLCSLPVIFWFWHRKLAIGLSVIIAILIGGAVLISIKGGSNSSRFLLKVTQGSNLKRLSQYQTSILAFKEKPVLGQGVNQFSSECRRIKEENDIWFGMYCEKFSLPCNYEKLEKRYCGHSHNIFLEMAANMGIIGFVFFCLWFFTWMFELIKRQDLLGVILLPFMINFLIASQFEVTFDANNSFLIFTLYPLSFLRKEDLRESLA